MKKTNNDHAEPSQSDLIEAIERDVDNILLASKRQLDGFTDPLTMYHDLRESLRTYLLGLAQSNTVALPEGLPVLDLDSKCQLHLDGQPLTTWLKDHLVVD